MANNDLLVKSDLPSLQTNVTSQPKQPTRTVQTENVSEATVVQKQASTDALSQQPNQQQQQTEALREKVAQLNDYMQNLNRNLQFTVDDQSGDTVVRVVDSETEEVVRQIPSEEILEARHAAEKYRGILLETKA
ncbi:MAG TPA: flagellar protein FlaG [Methylophaga aminisulfidivorans]|uniref:Flagellar protein FlaG n=2 Tax=root TaxID=1 RepID=A0A7C1W0C0_9GAMM|nr:flagellar protein FlaG [Methylophaga aminisulfidivorans]